VLSEDILPVTSDSQLCTVRILKYIASNEFLLNTLLTAPFALCLAGPINLWLARNMLPAEAFEMGTVILTLSAAINEAKARRNSEKL
jgi:predicted small integral membrane protein